MGTKLADKVGRDSLNELNATQGGIVEAFHKAFDITGIESCATRTDFLKLLKLRKSISDEEYIHEYTSAFSSITNDIEAGITPNKNDINELIDGAVDSAIVLIGTLLVLGVNFDEVFCRVMQSNFTKLDKEGNVLRREDGKVLKSDLYEPPVFDDMVEALHKKISDLT